MPFFPSLIEMNQNSIPSILAHLNLCIFTLILLSRKSSSINGPHYEACVPKGCGNGPDISYPFYIQGQQQSYCGYPGFELNCTSNGFPILHIPQNDYVVQQIYYTNQSLRAYNAAAVSNNRASGCFPPIQNVTLDRNPVFRFGNHVSNLVLLSDCNQELPDRLINYTVGCNGGGSGLAMLEDDGNLRLGKEECGENVVGPVELYGGDGRNGIGGYNYEELLGRGFLLNWTAVDCSICESSGGRCGFNTTTKHFLCFCPDRPHASRCRNTPLPISRLRIALAIGTSAVGVVIIVILLLCYFWRKCSSFRSAICLSKMTNDHEHIEAFLKKYGPLAPERYKYSDIKKMTNSFKEKLGQGGFGAVYKGKLSGGCIVAVKILNKPKGSGEDFVNEVASISRTSHVNMVRLLGFCFEGSKRALIYEFMPNGSLEKFIYNDKSTTVRQLEWKMLYEIALGVARGLEYLHRGCNMRILHFDIKPHNILLNEEFSPKISDFGLAKLCPEKNSVVSMSEMRGTPGYIAPELFFRNYGGASHKSDVYSYGMMLLEMAGGRKNIEVEIDHPSGNYSDIYFPDWLYNRLEQDKEIELDGITNEEENKITRKMILAGLWCIQTDPTDRPLMRKVLEMLEGSLESLQIPPRPALVSLPRCQAPSSTT